MHWQIELDRNANCFAAEAENDKSNVVESGPKDGKYAAGVAFISFS